MGRDGIPARVWRGLVRLRVLIFFLAGLAALDRMIGAHAELWLTYAPEFYRKRLAGCRERPHEVAIVGSSPTMCGVDPAGLIGLEWRGRKVASAFNAGIVLATTTEVWHEVEHGLTSAPPRLLIYGITASDLNESRVEPEGPRVLMDLHDLAEWMRLRPSDAPWSLRHFACDRLGRLWNLYYYRDGIRLWAADRLERFRPGLCPETAADARTRASHGELVARGEPISAMPDRSTRLDCLKTDGAIDPSFPFLDNYRLGAHLVHLHRLLDWAEARGVPVVLLDLPVSADLEERMCPGPFATYHSALAEVERTRGVRVLRATRAATGIGDADFADWVHLNADGMARLTRWVRQELEANDRATCQSPKR